MNEPDYLSVEQVAAVLGKSRKTVYRYLREKHLPSYKVGNTHLVRRDVLYRWIEAQAAPIRRPLARPRLRPQAS
ncbi:MAG: DNA-binding protein [Planctomycetota bacterium]|nr:MAG: DNA-binding protein [Planctomycetota bacterium]